MSDINSTSAPEVYRGPIRDGSEAIQAISDAMVPVLQAALPVIQAAPALVANLTQITGNVAKITGFFASLIPTKPPTLKEALTAIHDAAKDLSRE